MTLKNYWDKPENRARASERMKAYWAKISPEARTIHINNTARVNSQRCKFYPGMPPPPVQSNSLKNTIW